MIKNLVLGQYVPGSSFLHRLNPKVKLIFSCVFVVLLFMVKSFVSLGVCVVFMTATYLLCRFSFRLILNSLKFVMILILIALAFNLFFIRSGEVVFRFFCFVITTDSIVLSARFIIRMFLLLSCSSLLTYTTLPFDLTLAIEELLKPLSWFRVPVSEISIMLSIALRFVPLLISEAETITVAQKSRGLDLKNQKSIINRVKVLVAFLIPLMVSAFKRADDLAISMESRCFRVGKPRTRYKFLSFCVFDFYVVLGLAVFLGLVVFLNFVS